MVWGKCDQIGWFLEVLGSKFLPKVAQLYGDFLCNLENHHFLSSTVVTNFGQRLKKFGKFFIPTSDHTVWGIHFFVSRNDFHSSFFVVFLTVDAMAPTPQHQLFACNAATPDLDWCLLLPRLLLQEGRQPTELKSAESRSPASNLNFPPFLVRLMMRSVQEAHLPLSTPTLRLESLQSTSAKSDSLSTKLDAKRLFRGMRDALFRNFKFPAKSSSLSAVLSSQEWSIRWQCESSRTGGAELKPSSKKMFSTFERNEKLNLCRKIIFRISKTLRYAMVDPRRKRQMRR